MSGKRLQWSESEKTSPLLRPSFFCFIDNEHLQCRWLGDVRLPGQFQIGAGIYGGGISENLQTRGFLDICYRFRGTCRVTFHQF